MANTGNKDSDFKDSLLVGSADDYGTCCDSCLSDGRIAEADRFCMDCHENLCKLCLDAHKILRVLQHHKLEDNIRDKVTAPVQKQPLSKGTEMCTIHSNGALMFFCRNHDTLGCSDCVTLYHINCHTDYIPEVYTEVTKSNEFKKTLDDIAAMLKQDDVFRKEANNYKTITRENIADTINQIEEFQKNLNEKLNTLKSKMVKDLKAAESAFDQHVHEAISRSDRASSELKSVKANLETSLTTGNDAQAFTTMKHAQSTLKTLNISACKDKLLAEKRMFKFEPNKILEDILSTSEGLGKILSNVFPVYSFCPLIMDLNVRRTSDKGICDINGCDLLLPGKLVITDGFNSNVIIVDVKEQSVVEEYPLPTYPSDVAVLPRNNVAVTLPEIGKIQILKTKEKLLTLNSINVNRMCLGIAYFQDLMYVLCRNPNSVLVLDMRGTVQRDIQLKSAFDQTFSNPCRIDISKGLKQMYICDWKSNLLVSLTLQGEVTAVYKNDNLMHPLGITVLEDGSLLECCLNGVINLVSADLTQGRGVAESVIDAKSICYDSSSKTADLGSYSDHIFVFALK